MRCIVLRVAGIVVVLLMLPVHPASLKFQFILDIVCLAQIDVAGIFHIISSKQY